MSEQAAEPVAAAAPAEEQPKENSSPEKEEVKENGTGEAEAAPEPEAPKDRRAVGGIKNVKILKKPEPTLNEGEVLIRGKACTSQEVTRDDTCCGSRFRIYTIRACRIIQALHAKYMELKDAFSRHQARVEELQDQLKIEKERNKDLEKKMSGLQKQQSDTENKISKEDQLLAPAPEITTDEETEVPKKKRQPNTQLMPAPNKPDAKPFTTFHYIKFSDKIPDLTQYSMAIQEASINPPHFRVIVGSEVFEIVKFHRLVREALQARQEPSEVPKSPK